MSLEKEIRTYADDRMWGRGIEAIAAGLERDYYLVKLADLPEVTDHGGPDGPHMLCGHTWVTVGETADECEQRAREYIALATAKRSRESEAAVLQARRDELVHQYGYELTYDDQSPVVKDLINRLIYANADHTRAGERS